jgi:hypothetical protein
VGGWAAFGLLSRQFGQNPGVSTFANKSISGAQSDNWSESEFGILRGKNGLCYAPLGATGLSLTFDGWSASGRPVDITIGADYLKSQWEAAAVRALAANERIPFSQAGLDYLGSQLQSVSLANSGEKEILAAGPPPTVDPDGEGPYVTIPRIQDVPANDRALRFADGFQIHGIFNGAVHTMGIVATLSTGG